MGGGEQELTGPDFAEGYVRSELREGEPVQGHKDGEPVLLVLLDGEIRAVGASCTHYGGPLGEGLVVDGRVRCPWHHACFSLRTGEAVAAPALNPLPTWQVEVRDGRVFLGSRQEEAPLSPRGRRADGPDRVVIVGAGAAGSAAAEALRREGHRGSITLVDPDATAPYDRPNLSKDYLAGNAPEEWIPLRPPGFWGDNGIERVTERAVGLDRERGVVQIESGDSLAYDALLLATGATPRTLDVPGSDGGHVHTLRSLDQCRRIIEDAEAGRRAVVVGASFIGMEVAASLRARGLDVTVVAPETVPFERVLGRELGSLLRREHEDNGVSFRLGRTLARVDARRVVLDDATEVEADLVVVGVGVRPDTALAESAGLSVDNGVLVDDKLRTSDPRIWVAGDAARFLDARTGERIRIEHWVVAQRQGQTAARNILGRDEPFDDVPFFWTTQFGVGVSWVGHAAGWDRVAAEGDGKEGRAFRYYRGDRLLALATLGRDRLSLETEAAMEAGRA
jgi:NADPH-dependent 2,4-dienoyl-CoA reductase/sulfur reductase-like enzyme/nitrite reductase/ring-hydroxylating ferredoxin subunit